MPDMNKLCTANQQGAGRKGRARQQRRSSPDGQRGRMDADKDGNPRQDGKDQLRQR